ncbi:MAG: caspase family protein [Saprospiraceae bacterium]
MSGNLIRTFRDSTASIPSVAFSPDGEKILTSAKYPSYYTDEKGWRRPIMIPRKRKHAALLWDTSGQLITTYSEYTEPIIFAAFSPTGDSVLTACQDSTITLWNLNGDTLKTFKGPSLPSSSAFSPDGKYILTAWGRWSNNGHAVKLWSTTGQPVQSFDEYTFGLRNAVFLPDGKKILMVDANGIAKIRDLAGKELVTFTGHGITPNSLDVATTPRGVEILAGCSDQSAKLLNLADRKMKRFCHSCGTGSKSHLKVPTAAFSADGSLILTGGWDPTNQIGNAKLWDAAGRELKEFKGHKNPVTSVAIAPNGKKILTNSWNDDEAKLWDSTGVKKKTLLELFTSSSGRSVAFSPKGDKFVTGGIDYARLWKTTGKKLKKLKGYNWYVSCVAFSPDGATVLAGSGDKTVKLWDLSGQVLQSFIGHNAEIESVAFSPDGKQVLTASRDYTAKLWDTSGQLLKTFKGHKLWLVGAAFLPGANHILTASTDRTLKFWSAPTGQELASLLFIDSTDWIATTPSGLFDASEGAMALMHYVVNYNDKWEVIELEQLKERYFEPGLLQKVLGYVPGGLRPVNDLDQLELYPEITDARIEDGRLHVQLEERNGGIGKVMLLLNDVIELESNANPEFQSSFVFDLNRLAGHFLPGTANHLSLRAYNSKNWLKGPPFRIDYRPSSNTDKSGIPSNHLQTIRDAPLEAINLYALVVGTARYRGDDLKLTFPDKDAIAFAEALDSIGRKLFRKNIEVQLLTTSAEPWPRKAEIAKAIRDIAAKADPDDILLVYFSGHGITYPPNSEKGQFYYLTTDILSDKLDDESVLRAQAIAQDTLQEWIRQVKARKRILILDACNSGAVVDAIVHGRALNSDQRRSLERMKDLSGMFVLAGSAADKASFEATPFGHGLLTYSLLNNMPKVAASNGTYIDVGKLFTAALNEVPRLAAGIDRMQKPEMIGTGSYDIGIIDGEPPFTIPRAIPVFLRTNFLDRQKFKDVQELSKAVNTYLESLATQDQADFAFWGDVFECHSDHYYIGGLYQTQGETITGEAKLYKKDKELATIPFSGTVGALDKLAESIFEAAAQYVN